MHVIRILTRIAWAQCQRLSNRRRTPSVTEAFEALGNLEIAELTFTVPPDAEGITFPPASPLRPARSGSADVWNSEEWETLATWRLCDFCGRNVHTGHHNADCPAFGERAVRY